MKRALSHWPSPRHTYMKLTLISLSLAFLTGCIAGPPGPPPLPGLGPDTGWVFFFAITVGIVVWLARTPLSEYWHRRKGANNVRSYKILQERYAKGEISRDEYLRIASDLDAHEHPRGA
jgi:hypothetical protein